MQSEADDGMHRMPRWVKVFGIIGAVAVLLLLLVLAFGGEEHGPGRHATHSGDDGTLAPHEHGENELPASFHAAFIAPGAASARDGKAETR